MAALICEICNGPKKRARGTTCKACSKVKYKRDNREKLAAKAREHYRANKPKELARVAKYAKTPKRQDYARKYMNATNKRLREVEPNVLKARAAIMLAMRHGEVKREACQICGNAKTDAHHHKGYAPEHWLDVIFLCRKHHRAWHRIFLNDPELEFNTNAG